MISAQVGAEWMQRWMSICNSVQRVCNRKLEFLCANATVVERPSVIKERESGAKPAAGWHGS